MTKKQLLDKLVLILESEDANNTLTFETALEQYIRSKENILSPSTIRGYRILQRNAYDYINNLTLSEINELVLQKWANHNAIKYASKTINNQFGLITAVFKQNRIEIDTSSIRLKPKEPVNYIVPTPDEMHTIISSVYGEDIEIPVLFALLLGLRQSEIQALKWSNYRNCRIYVKGAIVPNENNKLIEKSTNKSFTSTRELAVPDYLIKRLDSIEHKGDYIVNNLTPNMILDRFFKLQEKYGMRRFTMHSLRHANASLMLQLGISDKYAMERLGHSTPYMLRTIYQHTFNEEHRRVADKVNKAINDLL